MREVGRWRGYGELAEEGGGEARVETEGAGVFEDVEECAGHGRRHGAGAGLESDFYYRGGVSYWVG